MYFFLTLSLVSTQGPFMFPLLVSDQRSSCSSCLGTYTEKEDQDNLNVLWFLETYFIISFFPPFRAFACTVPTAWNVLSFSSPYPVSQLFLISLCLILKLISLGKLFLPPKAVLDLLLLIVFILPPSSWYFAIILTITRWFFFSFWSTIENITLT